MNPILLLPLLAAALSTELPWRDLSLSIERDQTTSSNHVTLCRVRVVNHGWHTWPGKSLRFEARAVEAGVVVARERGRFGLSLPPRGSLETIVGFLGRYVTFEVEPIASRSDPRSERRKRQKNRREPGMLTADR